MARLNNKLVIQQMPWHANMTEMNHLGAAMIIKPTIFEGKMSQVFSATKYAEKPLTKLLSGAREETIDNDTWEWKMRGATTRPLVVIENVEPDSNVTPGKYKAKFKLKLDENWRKPGDVLTPGTSNKKYQVRVVTLPFKQGKGWIYEVEGNWDDMMMFIPVKYLQAGQQWSKLFSQYEEGSDQAGSTDYSLPIAMQNRMSRYKKEYSVTGDAATQVLAVKIPDSKGNIHDMWIKYAELEYWNQWYDELERGLWYSRTTSTVQGDTGRPTFSGPGLQQQLEDSHQHYYNTLTTRLIEEFLMDIFYSRVKPGKQRDIEAWTGEYGMLQFSRAIEKWAEKRRGFIQVVDKVYVENMKSEYSENGLVAGYQYVKYRLGNGGSLSLRFNPLYDDREINNEIDPLTGYPVESQRLTFLDFSGSGAESNMKIMNQKNSFKLGYTAGLTTPYGPVNNKLMSHTGDWYTMVVHKKQGLHIEDVSKCGELILATQ